MDYAYSIAVKGKNVNSKKHKGENFKNQVYC